MPKRLPLPDKVPRSSGIESVTPVVVRVEKVKRGAAAPGSRTGYHPVRGAAMVLHLSPPIPGQTVKRSDLRGRHFLKLEEWSPAEILHLVDLAARLKQAKRDKTEQARLIGRNIVLL